MRSEAMPEMWRLNTDKTMEAPSASDELDELVRAHTRLVFRVAYSVLRSVADSEDVVQETFFKVHRTRSWRRMDDPAAVLAKTAWRLAISRAGRVRPDPQSEHHLLHLSSSAPGPEAESIHLEQTMLLHKLMDGLPEKLQKTLALSALQELNSRQIAAILAVPEGTVRRRLLEARHILKQRFLAATEKPSRRKTKTGELL